MFSPFKNIESIIAAVLGWIVILLFTHHSGIGISRDSIAYISGADSFAAGKGFIEYDHVPLTLFPIGFPVILGVLKLVFFKPIISFGAYFTGFLFTFIIYLVGCITKPIFSQKILFIILLAIIVFATPLHEVFIMLWSETMFILWQIVFIISLTHYLKKPTTTLFCWVIFIAAFAAITRFAGITFIATLCLCLLFNTHFTVKKRWMYSIAAFALSILPLVLNLIRNYTTTTEVAGNRQKGIYTLMQNIGFSGKVYCEWIYLNDVSTTFTLIAGLSFLIILVTYSIYIIVGLIHHNKPVNYYQIATIMAAIYDIFMLTTATLSRYETINNRLLSPLYIPLLLMIVHLSGRIMNSALFASLQRAKTALIAVLFLLLLSKELIASNECYQDTKEGGIGGYTEDSWRESPTIQHVLTHLPNYTANIPVYSNSAHALYLYSGQYFKLLPEKTHTQRIDQLYHLSQFYVIWFNEEGNDDMLPLQTIQQNRTLKCIQQFSDGSVYFCSDSLK